jgi:hypothetical protein
MCGRFTQVSAMEEMAQHFGVLPPYPNAPARYLDAVEDAVTPSSSCVDLQLLDRDA